ncbi:MAG TPA: hypothetical protein VLA49_08055 [Anaerolineales bacterium]|nr:hypothetical protein [Anaerolineales bacterium]
MSDQTPSIQTAPETNQSFSAGSCLSVALRIIVATILGILLGLAIFYGVPALYQRFVLPIENSLTRLEDSQARQADENQRLNNRLDDLQSRIKELELQNDDSKQALDELQTLLANLEGAQEAREQALEDIQASSNERIEEVARSVEQVNQSLQGLDSKLADFEATLSQTNGDIQEVAKRLIAEDTPVAALRRELRLVMAMELLTRSRLFLVQDNLGLAQNDIQAAHTLLTDLQTRVPDYQVGALQDILDGLEAALENLPDRPILAAENLEVAWQLLQGGLPDELPLPTASQTEEPTATPTPTTSP